MNKVVKKAKIKAKAKQRAKAIPKNLVDVGKANFTSFIASNNVAVLYLWGQYCGPCKDIGPEFERLARRYKEVSFGKVNAGEEHELTAHLGVRHVPTMVVFYHGVLLYKQPMVPSLVEMARVVSTVYTIRPQRMIDTAVRVGG